MIYSRVLLGADDRASIEKQLRGEQDRCIKCGGDDHFVPVKRQARRPRFVFGAEEPVTPFYFAKKRPT
jgi:hypothetical protein